MLQRDIAGLICKGDFDWKRNELFILVSCESIISKLHYFIYSILYLTVSLTHFSKLINICFKNNQGKRPI